MVTDVFYCLNVFANATISMHHLFFSIFVFYWIVEFFLFPVFPSTDLEIIYTSLRIIATLIYSLIC